MPQLTEEDFIHEEVSNNPGPLIWFIVLVLLTGVGYWGIQQWRADRIDRYRKVSPFLQVTNREMSLFLWQNPQWMRINQSKKTGYLPAFESNDRGRLNAEMAEGYVLGSPELLFAYHQWQRLLGEVWIPRPIPAEEFRVFLQDRQEWLPRWWAEASDAYSSLIEDLPESGDLASSLPLPVKQAFQGWKNFFIEGEAINEKQFSADLIARFLAEYPQYKPHLWKNLFPGYLEEGFTPGFLRLALFNFSASQESQSP